MGSDNKYATIRRGLRQYTDYLYESDICHIQAVLMLYESDYDDLERG
jgi:phosphopantetheine adenylyltransferase